MNRQQRRATAKKIAQLEKSNKDKNNISENFESELNYLISNCSIEDLLEIDEIIMKKYLTK